MARSSRSDNFALAATVSLDGQVVGRFGLIDQAVQERFDLQLPVACAEFAVDRLLDAYPPQRRVVLPMRDGLQRIAPRHRGPPA